MIDREIILAYALENALAHGGKAFEGAVLKPLFLEGLSKNKVKDIMSTIQDVIKEINSMTPTEQRDKYGELKDKIKKREKREGLVDLPDVKVGEVVMRFAPFPSGALHIGNARQLILNDGYGKKYHGRLVLVMDDTIGSIGKPIEKEAYNLIKESVDWLDVDYDKKIIYKSDRLKIYYAYAEEMIKKGYMYICSCSADEIRELRRHGVECSCRNLPPIVQMKRWGEMSNAEEGKYVVRLKTSMHHKNPAFRDRVMFKISDRKHPRVGKKFRVWPLLDFSSSIDDHLLGITHIIRGADLLMETEVEKYIWDIFKWKHPIIIHTGLISIEGIKVSTSKGAQGVRSGDYIGWNDPRLWSLQSLRDRGILPESIKHFLISAGITKNNSMLAIDVLYAINKKHLQNVPRYFFVENPVRIKVGGTPKLKAVLPMHPNEKLGYREYETLNEFYISGNDSENMVNGYYRFMHLLNFKTDDSIIMKGRDYSFISENQDESLNAKYIHWLPANVRNIEVEVVMTDGSVAKGLGEPELLKLKKDQIIQFERFGFVRLHKLDTIRRKAQFFFTHR